VGAAAVVRALLWRAAGRAWVSVLAWGAVVALGAGLGAVLVSGRMIRGCVGAATTGAAVEGLGLVLEEDEVSGDTDEVADGGGS
jgi:hypothetical protein